MANLVGSAVTHRILRSLIVFTPMLLRVTIADNLTEASPRPTRLRIEIEVPDALAGARLPPMMLLILLKGRDETLRVSQPYA